MGFFEDYDPQSFTKWVRGNGSTQNKNTGPPFDHTLFNPEGIFWATLFAIQFTVGETEPNLAFTDRENCEKIGWP